MWGALEEKGLGPSQSALQSRASLCTGAGMWGSPIRDRSPWGHMGPILSSSSPDAAVISGSNATGQHPHPQCLFVKEKESSGPLDPLRLVPGLTPSGMLGRGLCLGSPPPAPLHTPDTLQVAESRRPAGKEGWAHAHSGQLCDCRGWGILTLPAGPSRTLSCNHVSCRSFAAHAPCAPVAGLCTTLRDWRVGGAHVVDGQMGDSFARGHVIDSFSPAHPHPTLGCCVTREGARGRGLMQARHQACASGAFRTADL